MKKRYEIRFDGKVIDSESLPLLKRIANGTECYYEIYVYYRPDLSKSASTNSRKLSIMDMREIERLSKKGYIAEVIGKKFGVGKDYINRILSKLRSDELLNK